MAPKRRVAAKKKPTVAKKKPPTKKNAVTLTKDEHLKASPSINYDSAIVRQGLISTYTKKYPLYFKQANPPNSFFTRQAPEQRKTMANILKDMLRSLSVETSKSPTLHQDYRDRTIKREVKYEKAMLQTQEASNNETSKASPPKKKTKQEAPKPKEDTPVTSAVSSAPTHQQHKPAAPSRPQYKPTQASRPQYNVKQGDTGPNVYSHPSTEQNPERDEYQVAKLLENYVKKMFMASEKVHAKVLRQVNSIDYMKEDFTKSLVDMKGLSLLMRLGGGPGFQQGAIDSRSDDGTFPRTVLSAESVVIMAKAMETFIQDLAIKMWMSKEVEPMSDKFDGYLDPVVSDNHLIRTIQTVEYLDFLAISNYGFEEQWEEIQNRKQNKTKQRQEDYINTILKMYENCDDKPAVVVNYMEFLKQRTSMEQEGEDVSEFVFDRSKTYPTANVVKESDDDSEDLPEPDIVCGVCKLGKEDRKKQHMLMYRAKMGISDDVADEDIDINSEEESKMNMDRSDSENEDDYFWNHGMAMNFPPYGLGKSQTTDLTEDGKLYETIPINMEDAEAQLLKLLRRRIRANKKDDLEIEARKAANKAEEARKENNAKLITKFKKKFEKKKLKEVFGERWKYEYKQFYKKYPDEEEESSETDVGDENSEDDVDDVDMHMQED